MMRDLYGYYEEDVAGGGMYDELGNPVLDKLKEYGAGLKERALQEVEARAGVGAEEKVKPLLMVSMGLSGVAILLSLIAIFRK